MPVRDIYHTIVKQALQNEDWTITHDPYPIGIGLRTVLIDLGAEKLIAAEKKGKKIAVEIKSFETVSLLTELEKAIGQIRLYKFALLKREPERILFVAIPLRVHKEISNDSELNEFIGMENINFIIFDPEKGEIIEWMEKT